MQLFHPHFKLLQLEFLKMVMNWEPEIICVKFLLECPFANRPNAISATSVCYCSASANRWATYLLYQIHITQIGFYQLRQFFYKVCDTFSKQGWYLSQLSKKNPGGVNFSENDAFLSDLCTSSENIVKLYVIFM